MMIWLCLMLMSFATEAFGFSESISDRATNPITNMDQLQTENDFSPRNYGTSDSVNKILIKPLVYIDRQLIRFKFQIPTLPNSSTTKRGTALGDTQFFDLLVTEDPSWGRWGIGPMAIFPTASKLDAGQGKWQIGPACGISILKFPGWQFGFLAQNPISVAGNKKKSQQNYLLFQPFATYHFTKDAYMTINPEWTIDWFHRVKQLPLNFGFGYTFSQMKPFKIDTSLQIQWMAYQTAVKVEGYVNQTTIQFCLNILFN